MAGEPLFRFTPGAMPAETLERMFVQREPLAKRLMEFIRESAQTQNKHHTLLVGPRGIGKSHLVALVYYRVRAEEDLRERLRIAWLREEEWGVESYLDLLLRICRALQEECPKEFPGESFEALYSLEPAEAQRAAEDLVKTFVQEHTLFLLVENLDDLFRSMGDKGQRQWRAFLQENAFSTILATSQSLFAGVSRQTSPFYGFFRVQQLEEFSVEAAGRLLQNIAQLREDRALSAFLSDPAGRARVRTVHHLAGGNPRVFVIFAEFLLWESLDALTGPFLKTLDELTPYYQARLIQLSVQQRKIVEYLSERGAPATVKEVAQRCFISSQTASGQLGDLKEKGYVRDNPLGATGRDTYYELREPLMRMCLEVKKTRNNSPVRLMVDFLRLWYPLSELRDKLAQLSPEAEVDRNYLLQAIQIAEASPDPRMSACKQEFKRYFASNQHEKCLEVTEEMLVLEPDTFTLMPPNRSPFIKEEALRRFGPNVLPLFYTARRSAPEQLEWEDLAPDLPCRLTFGTPGNRREIVPLIVETLEAGIHSYSLAGLNLSPGVIYVWRVEPAEEAEAIPIQEGRFWIIDAPQRARCLQGCRAIAEGCDRDFVTLGLALFLAELELYQDALELIKRGPARAKHDSRVLLAHTAQALIYRQMGKNLSEAHERSAPPFRPPAEFLTWAGSREKYHADHATVLMKKETKEERAFRIERGLKDISQEIELRDNDTPIWALRGLALMYLGQLKEAVDSLRRAVDIKPTDVFALRLLAVSYQALGSDEAALECYDKAIAYEGHTWRVWYEKGFLLRDLGRYQASVKCFVQATIMDPAQDCPHYEQVAVLFEMGDFLRGLSELEIALARFPVAEDGISLDHLAEHTQRIIIGVFRGGTSIEDYRSPIIGIVRLYRKYKAEAVLAPALVSSAGVFGKPEMPAARAEMWLAAWQKAVGEAEEFMVPLRLVDVALRYQATKSKRVLLELPVEERKVVEQVLEIKE